MKSVLSDPGCVCVEFVDGYGWAGKRASWRAITPSHDWSSYCLHPGPGLQLLGIQLPQPGATGIVCAVFSIHNG